jgi:hypothetical protein
MKVTGAADFNRELIQSWNLEGENTKEWSTTYDLNVVPGEIYRVEIASVKGTTGNGGTGAGSGTGFAFSNPIWIEKAEIGNQAKILDVTLSSGDAEIIKTKAGDYYISANDTDALNAEQLVVTASEGASVEKTYDASNAVFNVTVTSAGQQNATAMKIYVVDGDGASVDPGENELEVTTDANLINNGEYFRVNASLLSVEASNAATVEYKYDTDKFDYRAFTPAAGVTVLNNTSAETGRRLTFMFDGYSAKDFGEMLFSVKEDAQLQSGDNSIDVIANYVLKAEDGSKSVANASGAVSFTSVGGGGIPGDLDGDGVITLIDLSNVIDMFGSSTASPDWNNCRFCDINNNGEIDILDISTIAQKIA